MRILPNKLIPEVMKPTSISEKKQASLTKRLRNEFNFVLNQITITKLFNEKTLTLSLKKLNLEEKLV